MTSRITLLTPLSLLEQLAGLAALSAGEDAGAGTLDAVASVDSVATAVVVVVAVVEAVEGSSLVAPLPVPSVSPVLSPTSSSLYGGICSSSKASAKEGMTYIQQSWKKTSA